eukprot:jgi/Pico_ML_1/55625/g1288.t1
MVTRTLRSCCCRLSLFDSLARVFLVVVLAFSGSDASPDRLCIFDFDETLWIRATNSVAEEARRVEEISERWFTTELLVSPAFQFGRRNKTVAMNNILRYYGMLDRPECAVLFDDNKLANKPHADATGVLWVHVDERIGITMDDFDQAERKLDRFCP